MTLDIPSDAVISERLQYNRAICRMVELDLSIPVELIEVKGWRFRFVPSVGILAGQVISRVFVTMRGELGEAKRTCRARYGGDTKILAGAALHTDAKFGDWDD